MEVTVYASRIKQGLNEESSTIREPGGKGTNVSRILHVLGVPVALLGFIGGYRGRYIRESLRNETLKSYLLNDMSETRCAYVIVDQHTKETMILRERGHPVSKSGKERLLSILDNYLKRSSFLCLSGSLPPGLPLRFYADICAAARKLGIRTLVDCSGATLLAVLRARPYFIKPNLEEAEAALGKKLKSNTARVDALYKLHSLGAENVLLSLGAGGALALIDGILYKARVPAIPVINPVGAGDALMAGLLFSLQHDIPWNQRLRCALGIALASTQMPSSGRIINKGLKKFMSRVRVSVERTQGYVTLP